MNPVWNCPHCGSRVALEGRIGTDVALRCGACGNLQQFNGMSAVIEYEDRVNALQLVQPSKPVKDLAREAMLSMQCANLFR